MQKVDKTANIGRINSWLTDVVVKALEPSGRLTVERDDLWEFLDHLPVAVLISTDQTCARIVGNKAAQALLQVPHGSNFSQTAPDEELPSFKVLSGGKKIDPDDLPMQRAARTGEHISRSECEILFESGERIYIAGHCIPLRDESGSICGSLGAFVDVTEQQAQLDKTDLVAREMAHRLKNTISLIQGLSRATIKNLLTAQDYSSFEARLINISEAQDLLAEKVTDVDLERLIGLSVRGVVQQKMAQVALSGAPVTVPDTVTLSLSMIFHELATNACKYGALSNAEGHVQISWEAFQTKAGLIVTVHWRESGGPTVVWRSATGFGSVLIERLARSLPACRTAANYLTEGLSFDLTFLV